MKIPGTSPLNLKNGLVEMNHGSGGLAMTQLIQEVFFRHFANPLLTAGSDATRLPDKLGRCVISTDSFVISPLFFPGGNIGSLAVHGTVNDIAMCGARPIFLTAAFIIEEGLPLATLNAIAESMAVAARDAQVKIVTGDTKVVERGKGDGVFINTTGIGVLEHAVELCPHRIRPGQKIIVSGTLGDHAIAVMASRENLEFETRVKSDSAALHELVHFMLQASTQIFCLRDPTRGGVAAALNELAHTAHVGMVLEEKSIPIRGEVQGACELLGFDPLYLANEGKLLCICAAEVAQDLVATMRQHSLGRDAAIIGEVVADIPGLVRMTTQLGGTRLVDWPLGELLPRIC